MPKSIYLTDGQYQQVVAAAKKCGFIVRRGRGSQLALFVVMASNFASTQTGLIAPDNSGGAQAVAQVKDSE